MKNFLRIILRSWQSHFWTNLATLTVLTLSFSLILGTLLTITNLSRLFTLWEDQIQITVYLKDDINESQRTMLESQLSHHSGVDKLQFISKNQAQASFEKSLSSYGPQFLKTLQSEGDNPFPASFVVTLARDKKTPEFIEGLAQEFTKISGVEDISYGQEWIKNYATILRGTQTVAVIFTTVLLFACLFTVSNAVQASLSSRREEIEILELIGATPKIIRRPFLIEGAFQGIFAAGLALVILGLVYNITVQGLEKVVGATHIAPTMQFFSVATIALIFGVGLLLGSVGSYLCVIKLNTGWAATDPSAA